MTKFSTEFLQTAEGFLGTVLTHLEEGADGAVYMEELEKALDAGENPADPALLKRVRERAWQTTNQRSGQTMTEEKKIGLMAAVMEHGQKVQVSATRAEIRDLYEEWRQRLTPIQRAQRWNNFRLDVRETKTPGTLMLVRQRAVLDWKGLLL